MISLKLQRIILKWLFPIEITVAIIIALSWPEPGMYIGSLKAFDYKIVSTLNIITVFIISGLTLKISEVKSMSNKKLWVAFIYGIIMIIGITPLAGLVIFRIPFQVDEFKYGFALFCSTPTTIASGVALSAQAGGNNVLALLVTLSTNMISVVTIPFWLKAIFASQSVYVDTMKLFISLILKVLIPLLIGQFLKRSIPKVHKWVDAHKTLLQILIVSSVSSIVWQALSTSFNGNMSISLEALFPVIAVGAGLHISYLTVNYIFSNYVFRFDKPEMITTVILCSGKQLSICVALVSVFTELGSEGYLTIPPVVAHLSQLFIDSFLAGYWGSDSSTPKSVVVQPETPTVQERLLTKETTLYSA